MTDVRDAIQVKMTDLYIREGPDRCTMVGGTGLGKSKIIINTINALDIPFTMILVDSTHLKDNGWRDEFEKFGMLDYYENNVVTETYQTAYKWKKEDVDLSKYWIVADEIDFAADVPELSKFFYEFAEEPIKILGITGFITASKRPWFGLHMPILYEYSANQAQNDNILNNIHFIFVKYDLSKDKTDITVKYKDHGIPKSFTQSENNAYEYHHKKYVNLIIAKEINNQKFLKDEITYEDYLKEINSLDYRIKMAIKERSDILLNSVASARMAQKLISYSHKQNPKHKVIVFSKRTDQSIKICGADHVYNGRISQKVANRHYEQFKNGNINVLGVCDKINRGANIDNLRVGIMESFYGSDTKATQRFGRMMRLAPDEFATMYILLPYYLRQIEKGEKKGEYEVKPTQQVVWASNMLRSTVIKKKSVWDYRVIKTKDEK